MKEKNRATEIQTPEELQRIIQGQAFRIEELENSFFNRMGNRFNLVFAAKYSRRQFKRNQKRKRSEKVKARAKAKAKRKQIRARQKRINDLAKLKAKRERERTLLKQRQTLKAKHRSVSLVQRIRTMISNSLYNLKAKLYHAMSLPADKKQKYNFKGTDIKKLRIASIMDEFTYNCFKYEMNLHPLAIDNPIEHIDEIKPDILFIESAWRGSDGQWKVGLPTNYNKLVKLTKHCKAKGIPVLFWCKEDPVHYSHFLPIAKLADYVFTTDADMIEAYKEEVGHNDVYVLPFAAQPHLHNPTFLCEREDKASFAGSYYRRKYEERGLVLCEMIEGCLDIGVDIYDRNYDSGIQHYLFPDEYLHLVKGKLPYSEIQKAYKGYKINLNLNTITQSPTMFSRRVFESLACSTPLLSNYSLGVELMFGDLINMSENAAEYKAYLNELFSDEVNYQSLALRGMREVLSNHTYRHRAISVLAPLNGVVTLDNYSILVLGVAKTVEEAEHLIAMFNAQTYKNKHMVLLVPNHMKRIIPSQPSIQIEDQARFKTPNKTMTNSDYITLFDAEAFYGTHYLTDFMNTTTYSDYDVVVKGCNLQVVNNELMYNTVLLEYKEATGLVTLKNSMVKTRFFMTLNHASLTTPFNSSYFVIDSFNYFENNYELSDELKSKLAI